MVFLFPRYTVKYSSPLRSPAGTVGASSQHVPGSSGASAMLPRGLSSGAHQEWCGEAARLTVPPMRPFPLKHRSRSAGKCFSIPPQSRRMFHRHKGAEQAGSARPWPRALCYPTACAGAEQRGREDTPCQRHPWRGGSGAACTCCHQSCSTWADLPALSSQPAPPRRHGANRQLINRNGSYSFKRHFVV